MSVRANINNLVVVIVVPLEDKSSRSLSRAKMAIANPKFGVYIINIYVLYTPRS